VGKSPEGYSEVNLGYTPRHKKRLATASLFFKIV
jgi:hypothetical protein